MDYYLSDLHLNHLGSINRLGRDFSCVEEMNEVIINNWNKVVRHKDDGYLLGDVVWGDGVRANELISRLNGRLHLIIGNHDHKYLNDRRFDKSLFKSINSYKPQKIQLLGYRTKVILFHFPIADWDCSHYNAIHLHGHTHDREPTFELLGIASEKFIFNVSADVMGFKPQTLEQIMGKRLDEWLYNMREKRILLDIC